MALTFSTLEKFYISMALKLQGMWVLFDSFPSFANHIYATNHVSCQQIYDEASAKIGLKIDPPLI